MPNVMAVMPNIGGALCSTPQSLADAQYWSNERRQGAKPVEICRGAPNSPRDLSRYSGPKFTILRGHVEEMLLNNFSPIVDALRRYSPTKLWDRVPRWRFFACCIFSEPRAARFRPYYRQHCAQRKPAGI